METMKENLYLTDEDLMYCWVALRDGRNALGSDQGWIKAS
jgi:hypothetical protein